MMIAAAGSGFVAPRVPVYVPAGPGGADPAGLFHTLTGVGIMVTVIYLLVLAVQLDGYAGAIEPVQQHRAMTVWLTARWWNAALAALTAGGVTAGLGWGGMWPLIAAGMTAVVLWRYLPYPPRRARAETAVGS